MVLLELVFLAESIRITTEQGKADDIEERDGKVRKFNIISICWSILLSDVVVVSKNTLSDEAYPLKNDIAFANADMNDDTKVNAVDTSALIEDQLGKKNKE